MSPVRPTRVSKRSPCARVGAKDADDRLMTAAACVAVVVFAVALPPLWLLLVAPALPDGAIIEGASEGRATWLNG
jgi:hypothetical protein